MTQVVNAEAPEWVMAMLCHSICFPRLVLALAELRLALAELGHDEDETVSDTALHAAAFRHPAALAAEQAARLLQLERAVEVCRLGLSHQR